MFFKKWKEAKLYGNDLNGYQVSDHGEVKDENGKILGQKEDVPYYRTVHVKGKGNVEVYKIVASSFNPINDYQDREYESKHDKARKKEVHHIDNNAYNFNPKNLEWLSKSEHAEKHKKNK